MLNNILHKYHKRKTYDLLILYHIGALENSIHFILDKTTKECSIIDPAWNTKLFLDIVNKLGYKLTNIWLTHWHPDHTNATDELAQLTNAKIIAGTDEKPYLNLSSKVKYYNDEDIIDIGKTQAKVIKTPGHSKGGICYLLSDDLIAGDTLFIYGAGHTKLPGANIDDFYNSMQKINTIIPNDIYLRCGHNYGSQLTTTMAEQKQYNPYLFLDNKDDLINFINKMEIGEVEYPTNRVDKKQLLKLL